MAPFAGFTEDEVRALCGRYHREFASVRRWYDGYRLAGCHVYNPKAVVSVMLRGGFKSYWSNTGTYEAIRPLLDMDFDGLKAAVLAMLSGDSAGVRVRSFQNDVVSLRSRDDVLTLLIIWGIWPTTRGRRRHLSPTRRYGASWPRRLRKLLE